MTPKIELTTKFDVEYVHLLNFKYINYLCIHKHNYLYSYQTFSNHTYHTHLGSNVCTKRVVKKDANMLLNYKKKLKLYIVVLYLVSNSVHMNFKTPSTKLNHTLKIKYKHIQPLIKLVLTMVDLIFN